MTLPELPQLPRKYYPLAIGIFILLGAIGAAYYFYQQYRSTQDELKRLRSISVNTTAIDQQKILSDISKIIDLPTDEEPTIASVNDKSKLANQPFFARAENQDVILVYSNAKKAILYRPSLNKIIEVSLINVEASPSAKPTTPTP
ncbi:hypothetical protein A2634_02650 [Candidatus Amesbacteria bacterium RIFCSPHIGHO2_01_FULL_48_32]|uniref:Uncharacterized protein n=1 Tax=Candidatus Amesbacteria bacterium RIFCSPLOWO2_01_FULL_48_25 TaxID=1797259 RepID=A0A1F4ZD45_9BACT|nr:MAG: hypothetical protein A2634_02650 [Candidatus Amesbacteria bacterium RIFCSPHIGHO2_01_FULL_48_32]OGD04211.1 MAG: hypothetical protein A2989_01905 [Candidatus Amesbacteria bacterium RIFCSPLOWO2_01_FULL_48_25]